MESNLLNIKAVEKTQIFKKLCDKYCLLFNDDIGKSNCFKDSVSKILDNECRKCFLEFSIGKNIKFVEYIIEHKIDILLIYNEIIKQLKNEYYGLCSGLYVIITSDPYVAAAYTIQYDNISCENGDYCGSFMSPEPLELNSFRELKTANIQKQFYGNVTLGEIWGKARIPDDESRSIFSTYNKYNFIQLLVNRIKNGTIPDKFIPNFDEKCGFVVMRNESNKPEHKEDIDGFNSYYSSILLPTVTKFIIYLPN